MFSYFWNTKKEVPQFDENDITVSVAESVTAGAVCNIMCTEPGASSYFKGGVVTYSIASKKEILGIDTAYAELNNHANASTTEAMARAVAKLYKSRFAISTTGYSLPYFREENKEKGECALDIKEPYAIVCIYDCLKDQGVIHQKNFQYNPNKSNTLQKADMQAITAIFAHKLYQERVDAIKAKNKLKDIK